MASQIAQSVAARAPVCSGRQRSCGYGVSGTQSRAILGGLGSRLQPRGAKCAGLQRPLPNFGSSPSSALMGESLWGRVAAPKRSNGSPGGALGTTCSYGVYGFYGISPETVRWCVAAACTVLLLKRDAGAKKQFWAGILALEAPRDVVYWAKSEYGLWVACIGLALKLFYSLPAELDYPFAVYLLIATAPAQALAQRGTMGAAVLSAALACFVAFQYFSNTVRFSDAFKGEHLLNTILIVFTTLACIGFFGMTVL